MVGWANSVHRHSPSRPQTRRVAASLFVGREQALERPPIPHTNLSPGEALPARKRGSSSLYKTPLRPVVPRVQGESRVERGRRGREGRSTRASWRCWWCPRTPGASCFEAGHVPHLPGHLHAHTGEIWRRSEVACPPLSCDLVEGTTIPRCFLALCAGANGARVIALRKSH